jgi:hypothetical protein
MDLVRDLLQTVGIDCPGVEFADFLCRENLGIDNAVVDKTRGLEVVLGCMRDEDCVLIHKAEKGLLGCLEAFEIVAIPLGVPFMIAHSRGRHIAPLCSAILDWVSRVNHAVDENFSSYDVDNT